MSKYTDWYPSNILPKRKGIYEVNEMPDYERWFRYWNGKQWGMASTTLRGAFSSKNIFLYQTPSWRGLSRRP